MTETEIIILDRAEILAEGASLNPKYRNVSINWLRHAQIWAARRKSKILPRLSTFLKETLEAA